MPESTTGDRVYAVMRGRNWECFKQGVGGGQVEFYGILRTVLADELVSSTQVQNIGLAQKYSNNTLTYEYAYVRLANRMVNYAGRIHAGTKIYCVGKYNGLVNYNSTVNYSHVITAENTKLDANILAPPTATLNDGVITITPPDGAKVTREGAFNINSPQNSFSFIIKNAPYVEMCWSVVDNGDEDNFVTASQTSKATLIAGNVQQQINQLNNNYFSTVTTETTISIAWNALFKSQDSELQNNLASITFQYYFQRISDDRQDHSVTMTNATIENLELEIPTATRYFGFILIGKFYEIAYPQNEAIAVEMTLAQGNFNLIDII
jgi:hypothetical protein